MGRRLVGVWLGEVLAHGLHRLAFALSALRFVDLLDSRRDFPSAIGEIARRSDPVVIEVDVGVVNEGEPHPCAVARRHDRLMILVGEPTGRVQPLDAGVAGLWAVVVFLQDEALRAALITSISRPSR